MFLAPALVVKGTAKKKTKEKALSSHSLDNTMAFLKLGALLTCLNLVPCNGSHHDFRFCLDGFSQA
jgi:hypothetical protein